MVDFSNPEGDASMQLQNKSEAVFDDDVSSQRGLPADDDDEYIMNLDIQD